MKAQNNWYGPDQISSLIRNYAPHVTSLMSVSTPLGLTKQLDQIQQNRKYFIPLNINCLSQNFEEGKNNHWAGLYIKKDTYQTSVLYFDPMGKPMNSKFESQIKDKLTTDSIGQPLLNSPIQYAEDKGIQLAGNTNDCGPMLVYCVASLANDKNIRRDIKSLEQSISFGQFLRGSFDKNVSFEEIYRALQASQESAPIVRKIPSSKATPSSDTEDVDLFVSGILKAVEVGGSSADQAIDKVRKIGESSLPSKAVKIVNKSAQKSEAKNVAPIIDTTEIGKAALANNLIDTPPPSFERIMEAIKAGEPDYAKQLINKIDNNSLGELSRTDVTGEPLLHMAISAGYEEVAEALLDKKPSLAKTVDENGNTALHLAASMRIKEACMLLLPKMNLEVVTAINKDGNTAQDLVTKTAGNQELAKLILIHIIQEKIEEGNELISGSTEEAVLVIGSARAGKSTLVNYLTNPKNLEVILHKDPDDEYDDGKLVFDVIASKRASFPKIGYTKDSETTIPNKLANLEENLWYWDCPGFDDTKGEEQDIPNAFYIKKIFDTTSKFKLVLVIDYGDLVNDNSTKIKKLTDTLGNLFKGNELSTIVKGLSLIVTKADGKITERKVKSELVKLLKTKAFTTDSAGKTILQSLKDSESKIAIFKKPKEAGSLIDGDNAKILGNNDAILKIIEGTKFINNPVKINIAVSDASKLLIADLAQKVIDDSKGCIKVLSDTLDQSYKIKCSELKGAKKLAELKSLQDELVASLIKIIHSSIDNLQGEVQDFIDTLMLKFPGEEFLAKELLSNLQYLKFFKQIKADINLDITPWMEGFATVRDTMLKYTYMPEEQIVQIRGKTVTSDDIKAAINDDCFKELKAVEVYAAKELVLSSDLNHEKLKGINFSALAPCWKITTQVTIDLSGINGPSHAQQKADNGEEVISSNPDSPGKNGNDGSDGLPGLPGGHGGNFFGAGQEFTNIEYLTINVSGGQGGLGQNGGDGSSGTNATKHGSKEDVQGRARAVLKSMAQISIGSFGYSDLASAGSAKYLETYESAGKKGGIGGNSGKAGKGGIGGVAGIAKLFCLEDATNQPTVLNSVGNQGISGSLGQPGIGGKSGKIYYGEYINEKTYSEGVIKQLAITVVGGIFILGGTVGTITAVAIGTGGIGVLPLIGVGLSVLSAEGAIGLAGLAIVDSVQAVYNSYKNSGWQGEISERKDKAEDGKVVSELNSKDIKPPTPARKKSLINYDHLLKQYEKYLELIGDINKKFFNKITIELELPDNDPIHIMEENTLILAQDELEVIREDIVGDAILPILESQHIDVAGAVLDPTLNAFNQKNNSYYFYQAADIKMIQIQLQKEFGDKLFIAEPSGSNQPIDVLLESFMQSLALDKPMLCAVNHDNWHWVVTGITKQDTKIVIFNKDSMPNKKTQQGNIGVNLPENLTLLVNSQSEQIEGVDCGIFVLENMRIMARELIANPQAFIEAFSTYSNFCTLNKAQQLRSGEFAKDYVKGVCNEMINERQKHSILTKIRENHQQELFSIREALEKLSIDGSHIIILGANDTLVKGSQSKGGQLITPESKKDISQTIGLEVAVQAFNQQHKIYSYCYKITWTIDLDWGGNIKFHKVKELFKDTSLTPIEDFHNKLIAITPENCFRKYNFDLPLPKISFAEVCTALCIDHNQEQQNEAAVIFEEFMHELTKEQVVVSGGIVDSNVL